MLNKYLLIILVLFTSCKKAEKSSSDAPLVDLKTQIQTGLVNVSCTGCHAEPTARNHQVDLSDVSKGIKPANPAYIIPGCPDQSLFYTEMKVGSMTSCLFLKVSRAYFMVSVSFEPASKTFTISSLR